MRPLLRWLLATSAAAAAASLLWPAPLPEGVVVAAAQESRTYNPGDSKSIGRSVIRALPPNLMRQQFKPTEFDPFVGVEPPPPPPPEPEPESPKEAAPLPEPITPPVPNYRYIGRMTDPSGKLWVYLARNEGRADAVITATVGGELDDGYVIEDIQVEAIHLRYPPLDSHVILNIPPSAEAPPR